jgi:hypothetical protein
MLCSRWGQMKQPLWGQIKLPNADGNRVSETVAALRRILSSERLRYCHRHRSHTFREAVASCLNRNRE